MTHLTSQLAAEAVGNRYDLVLIASMRVKELRMGDLPRIHTTSGHVVTALNEVEAGLVGREYLEYYRQTE